MKKHLLIALFALAAGTARAQSLIPANTIQAGGSVGYFQRHNETSGFGGGTTDNYTFSVSPQVGYFVASNWVLGLGGGYSSDKSVYASLGTPGSSLQHYKGFYVGPFAQYYRLLTEHLGLTSSLLAAFNHGTTEYERDSSPNAYAAQSSGSGVSVSLTPGLVYFPVSRLALGATVGGLYYNYGRGTTVNSDGFANDWKNSSFGATFGLTNLALSGTYFFRRG